jgi:hypothetical protein
MNWYITAFCGARSKARSAPLLIDKNDAAAARLKGEVNATKIGELGARGGATSLRRCSRRRQ